MAPVSSIRYLGPATEAAFARIGIATAEALRELGADEAYGRLIEAGERPHFVAYYVLHMALQGRPWDDCKGEEKAALRARFDVLKAARAPRRSALEAFMDEFGLIAPTAPR
jgi:DNA transformation protein